MRRTLDTVRRRMMASLSRVSPYPGKDPATCARRRARAAAAECRAAGLWSERAGPPHAPAAGVHRSLPQGLVAHLFWHRGMRIVGAPNVGFPEVACPPGGTMLTRLLVCVWREPPPDRGRPERVTRRTS